MPYVDMAPPGRTARLALATSRWEAIRAENPDLAPAVAVQERLIRTLIQLAETVEQGRLPRLSLPPKYVAAKLARGVPALAGEPIPLPVAVLRLSLLRLCQDLSAGGAGEAADHIGRAIEGGQVDAGSLLAASVRREQAVIRTAAHHRGLAPDLLWLVAELATSPFVHAVEHCVLGAERRDPVLAAALAEWARGYCPACGSWPALAERVAGSRTMRCSFCAAAWQAQSGACIYCGSGDRFTVAEIAPGRRLELCGGCSSYLKVVDAAGYSPFPLLAIGDLETMVLDVRAMQQGFGRPPLREFKVVPSP